MRDKTFYEILNVDRTASQSEIEENYLVLKYLMLSKTYQSNLIQNDRVTPKNINIAYWTLKDEARRREYDLKLKFDEISEEKNIKSGIEFPKELSNFRIKMSQYLSLKRLRVAFLVISVFMVCFYGDASDINNIANRDIISATSILLYFLSLMSVMQML